MAFVNDDKLKNQLDSQQQSQSMPSVGSSGSGVVGSGSGAGANSTAGIGPGGTGGWTNIQSYLNANSSGAGSSQALQNRVGTQLTNERSDLESKSNAARSSAQSQADQMRNAGNSWETWLQQAGQNYNYGPKQKTQYREATGNLRNAVNSQYTAPSSFEWNVSDNSNQWGSALGNDQAFYGKMGDMYRDLAGGQLSQGGRTLQSQLDMNNSDLAATREKLLGQYAGLTDYANKTVSDVDRVARDSSAAFSQNQNAIKSGLENRQAALDAEIARQEAAARGAYDQEYRTGDAWADVPDMPAVGRVTWADLEKSVQAMPGWETPAQRLAEFKSDQDAKYSNTADAEERTWNAIQDILGTDAARKQHGFKVTGTDKQNDLGAPPKTPKYYSK